MTITAEQTCNTVMMIALELLIIPRGIPASSAIGEYMDSLDFSELCIEIEDTLEIKIPDTWRPDETFQEFATRIHALRIPK